MLILLNAFLFLILGFCHIAAMEKSVNFDIGMDKRAKNILFGEGLFFSKLT